MNFQLTPDRRGGSVFAYVTRAVGLPAKEFLGMCDYSRQSVLSRPAKVGDKLTTRNFGTGTRGFAATDALAVAVCVLAGTELAFSDDAPIPEVGFLAWRGRTTGHTTAIFRQVRKNEPRAHHD